MERNFRYRAVCTAWNVQISSISATVSTVAPKENKNISQSKKLKYNQKIQQ